MVAFSESFVMIGMCIFGHLALKNSIVFLISYYKSTQHSQFFKKSVPKYLW